MREFKFIISKILAVLLISFFMTNNAYAMLHRS